MQMGADRAPRGHSPGRELDFECLCSLCLQRISTQKEPGATLSAVPAPGAWAERMIIMSSSKEPTSATAAHAATVAPTGPCPSP
jgi:hypothetical protein